MRFQRSRRCCVFRIFSRRVRALATSRKRCIRTASANPAAAQGAATFGLQGGPLRRETPGRATAQSRPCPPLAGQLCTLSRPPIGNGGPAYPRHRRGTRRLGPPPVRPPPHTGVPPRAGSELALTAQIARQAGPGAEHVRDVSRAHAPVNSRSALHQTDKRRTGV